MGRRPLLWCPKTFIPKDICGIEPGFPGVSPAKGYVTYVLLTRSPLPPKGSLDLHVLSPPLAFALSQDQTLQFDFDSACFSKSPCRSPRRRTPLNVLIQRKLLPAFQRPDAPFRFP